MFFSRADKETILARGNHTDEEIETERTQNISIYVGLVAGCIILSLTRALIFFYILINASQHLHNKMFAAILRAPIYFFDSNPVGTFISYKIIANEHSEERKFLAN